MSELCIHDKYSPLFDLLDESRAEEFKNIRYVVLTSGRGAGKSFALGCFVNEATYRGYNVLFTRYTLTSAETSIIPEFREKCELLGDEDNFTFTNDTVTNNITDARIIYKGQKPSSKTANSALKSVNGISIFVTEEAQEVADFDLWDRINKSIRMKGKKNLVILVLNPTDVNHWIYREFFSEQSPRKDMTLFIDTNYLDNKDNLDEIFVKEALAEKTVNPKRYNNVWLGKWVQDTEGALWNDTLLQNCRIMTRSEEYKRIVVSVDPAVTSNLNSDEYGIIVAGETLEGKYHILEDRSQTLTPSDACDLVVSLYDFWDADCVVAEVNNGGDWIESLLRTKRENISYKSVRASRGKITRAEPVSSLYYNGKVCHVGYFKDLEFEMTTFTGDPKEVSPNRLDALVWALTLLGEYVEPPMPRVSVL